MFRFDGEKLNRAILARDRTVPAFAEDAEVNRTTIYRAIAGVPVTMTSAVRIGKTLKRLRVNPTLEELSADLLSMSAPEPRRRASQPDTDAAA
jgi:predicted transcriptional regulator